MFVRYSEFSRASAWHTIEPRYEGGHYGTHEPPVQKLLVTHLKLGSCFYDIGAHTGFFTVLAAALVWAATVLLSQSNRIGEMQVYCEKPSRETL